MKGTHLLIVLAVCVIGAVVLLATQMIEEEGIVTTDTGLKYKDITVGDGQEAKMGDIVTVHYFGKLRNGKQFDSSYDKDAPMTFKIADGQLIDGWIEGVPGMKVGGKRKLIIPPDLGYGPKGSGNGDIPGNSTLYFEIELLAIKEKTPRIRTEEDLLGNEEELIKTASGLRYKDMKEGDGAAASAGDLVRVDYSGWLLTGRLFDSSIDSGKPIEITLGQGQVIKGWDEGLVGMKVGGKRKLVIPPDLAYGADGRPPVIPGNSTLVFEVELLETK